MYPAKSASESILPWSYDSYRSSPDFVGRCDPGAADDPTLRRRIKTDPLALVARAAIDPGPVTLASPEGGIGVPPRAREEAGRVPGGRSREHRDGFASAGIDA